MNLKIKIITLTAVPIIVVTGVFVLVSKSLAPQADNNFASFSSLQQGNATSQDAPTIAPVTNQDTRKLQATIEANIAAELSNRPTYIKDVQVSQDSSGEYDVQVDVNEISTYVSDDMSVMLASVYIAVYKNRSADIKNASITQHFPQKQDQYGNTVDTAVETTSLDKTTADKFNWALDDNSLNPFVALALKRAFPKVAPYY